MIPQNENKTELYSVRTTQQSLTLTYRLFEQPDPESGNFRYSINAELRENDSEESVYIPYVSASRVCAESIFASICRGHVTPCTLEDIIDDIFESERE